ncbi:hypothetical protein [Stenotrophomonas sp. B1-1]|uniref:OB-fold protein n=1 Tax=Stenotrophomonas sp. B1-1 TaxID=2710648 RepID=UPI0013DC253D|nr:hypothetical protein [Stenotrophomonas sp. B1-1]
MLAIVAMAKGGATKGLFQLILSLVASPIVYFIGVSILAMGVNAAAQTSAPKANTSNTSATAELTDSAVKAPPAAVPISVSAEQLYSAYAENEISADARFKGKSLLISGKVQSIQSGIGDDPVVQLAAGTFQWVQLHGLSKDVAAGLSKGQQILVRCKGQGETIGFPSAAECQLQ